jgi:general secretion pathway protein B
LPTDAARPADPAPWRPSEERREPPPDAKGAAAGSAPAPAGGASQAEATVYPIDQLPPNIRGQVPQLVIGGSIYSPSASGRSLIVNGQLYRERERLTPDLTLEEIKLKAAVFSFRGYRFEVLF